MEPILLVIHIILALAIIGLVLIQRSEGGGLGIGGGGGGMGGLATAKGTANALTRATAICAALFFGTSLILGILAARSSTASTNLLSDIGTNNPEAVVAPVDAGESVQDMPVGDVPETPVENATPSAPIAE